MAETISEGREIRPNVTLLMSFFISDSNKKSLIHKEKARFPISTTEHKDFETFKKAVLDFCGIRSLAEAKGVGNTLTHVNRI